MIRLDATNKSIIVYSDVAATTTEPVFVSSWDDVAVPNQFAPGCNDGATNGSTQITMVASPAASMYRNIKYMSVANVDTAIHVITIALLNGATNRILVSVTLGIGEELIFNDGSGWAVLNNVGQLKVTGTTGANLKVGSVGFGLDNNGTVLPTGTKGFTTVPFSGTITGWVLFADQVGSVSIDVWKVPYAGYPPTVANSIVGTGNPSLTSQLINQSTNLSSWTNTTVNAGDIFAFTINSVSAITRLTMQLTIIKN